MTCTCKKVAYPSRTVARRSIRAVLARRGAKAVRSRRGKVEFRTYECPGQPGIWHTTSKG
jgi:hypothetical protein